MRITIMNTQWREKLKNKGGNRMPPQDQHRQDEHEHLSNGEQNPRNQKKQTPESYWSRTPTSGVTCLHGSS